MIAETQRGRPPWRVLALLVLIALATWGLDQVAKYLVLQNLVEGGPAVPIIGDLVQFRLVKNSGAAFSLGSGFTWVLSIVAVGVVATIIWVSGRIRSARWAAVFGLILGGALGNLTDRLFREPGFGVGHVIDYIQVIYFPAIFNVADIAITSSMVLFVLLTLLGIGLDGSRHPNGAAGKTETVEPDGRESGPVERDPKGS